MLFAHGSAYPHPLSLSCLAVDLDACPPAGAAGVWGEGAATARLVTFLVVVVVLASLPSNWTCSPARAQSSCLVGALPLPCGWHVRCSAREREREAAHWHWHVHEWPVGLRDLGLRRAFLRALCICMWGVWYARSSASCVRPRAEGFIYDFTTPPARAETGREGGWVRRIPRFVVLLYGWWLVGFGLAVPYTLHFTHSHSWLLLLCV